VQSGELEGRLMAINLFARFAAWSPDGRTIATSEGGHVRLWDAATQECLRVFPAGRAARPAFSGDGKLLAIAGEGGKVTLWQTATGALHRIWRAHDASISSLAFSPDARTLCTASSDGTIKFWRIASQRLLLTWRLLPAAHDSEFSQNWIAYTPASYYTGSPGCEQWIRWRMGDKLLPATTFRKTYRRSDLVKSALAFQE
jgi:WD40 repeat protein